MSDFEQHDAEFERSVTEMLARRSSDIVDLGASGNVDISPSQPERFARRSVPVGIAAAVVLFVGVLAIVMRANDRSQDDLQVVSEAIEVTEKPTPGPETGDRSAVRTVVPGPSSALVVPAEAGGPAEFFDASGNSLGFAQLTEVNGETVVLDPAGTDLVDLAMAQFEMHRPTVFGPEEFRGALATDGLRIYTTIDAEAQAMAQRAIDDTMPDDDRGFSMTILAMDPKTGSVIAAAGNGDEVTTTVARPLGSAYQMFLAGVAVEKYRVHPDALIDGEGPCEVLAGDGTTQVVENFAKAAGSVGSLRDQLARSSRCAFGRLLDLDDPGEVERAARPLLVSGEATYGEFTIGPRVSPFTVAIATTPFANVGLQQIVEIVTSIDSPEGSETWRIDDSSGNFRTVREQTACVTTSLLATNVDRGTGTRAQIGEQPTAGTTGTLDTFTDAWFVGYGPDLITVVWVGTSDPAAAIPMTNVDGRNVTGGNYPAEAFGHFNNAWHADRPVVGFPTCDLDGLARYPFAGTENCPSPPNTREVDTNGDGVVDICLSEESVLPGNNQCPSETEAIDTNGDGIVDQCRQVGSDLCPPGFPIGRDTDDDGVVDTCFEE